MDPVDIVLRHYEHLNCLSRYEARLYGYRFWHIVRRGSSVIVTAVVIRVVVTSC